MEEELYSTGEVAKLLGVKPHQISYAIANGLIPEPGRFCGKRAFQERDVHRIAEFFGVKTAPKRTQEGGPCTSTNT